ncbi:MAG: right-handed parallel beta-helix repeat-containing protein [Candidatus Eisenbacteria bacterium]|nr:right-handed parallel beta-helix repeat-containing protein [Candidatus Eisenbacteria bacterium]
MAESGDTVLVAAGNYSGVAAYGGTVFGKSLHVLVEGDGPAVFDHEGDGAEFLVVEGDAEHHVRIDGFELRGGNTVFGSLIVAGGVTVTLSNCTFQGIVGGEVAAVRVVDAATLNMTGCEFTANQCTENTIVSLESSRTAIVRECRFSRNRRTTIDCVGMGGAEIYDSLFLEEPGSDFGNSLAVRSPVRIEHCVFSGARRGAAISSWGSLDMRSCTVAGYRWSGAVRIISGDATIERSVFARNCGTDITVIQGSLDLACSAVDSVRVESGTVTYGEGMVFGDAALCDVPSCEEPWRLGDYRLVAGTVAASCPPCGFIYGAYEETCPGGGTGACCIGGECLDLSSECCEWNGGVYWGEGAACTPELCDQPIPIRRLTWGAIKARW